MKDNTADRLVTDVMREPPWIPTKCRTPWRPSTNGKGVRKAAGKGQCEKTRGQADAEYFAYKCHNCGVTGQKAAQCTREREGGRGERGVCGVDAGDGADAGVQRFQEMGDLELCVVEEKQRVGAPDIGDNDLDDLLPRIVALGRFDPWATYLDRASEYVPSVEQIPMDTGESARLRSTLRPTPSAPSVATLKSEWRNTLVSMVDIRTNIRKFRAMVIQFVRTSDGAHTGEIRSPSQGGHPRRSQKTCAHELSENAALETSFIHCPGGAGGVSIGSE